MTNTALQVILEGKCQPKEVNYTHENTRNNLRAAKSKGKFTLNNNNENNNKIKATSPNCMEVARTMTDLTFSFSSDNIFSRL